MSWVTAGDTARERAFQEWQRLQNAAATAERVKEDRIERSAKALSSQPQEELEQLALGWSSYTDCIKPAAARAIQLQQEKEG
jgi:hypothetical protein